MTCTKRHILQTLFCAHQSHTAPLYCTSLTKFNDYFPAHNKNNRAQAGEAEPEHLLVVQRRFLTTVIPLIPPWQLALCCLTELNPAVAWHLMMHLKKKPKKTLSPSIENKNFRFKEKCCNDTELLGRKKTRTKNSAVLHYYSSAVREVKTSNSAGNLAQRVSHGESMRVLRSISSTPEGNTKLHHGGVHAKLHSTSVFRLQQKRLFWNPLSTCSPSLFLGTGIY